MTGTSPSKIVTPCTSFVPPLKSTIASPEMTIEHLAQISRLTCLFKSRLDQDDLTCKSCQWWHWINDDNDDTEPGWLAVRVLPTPSCHHCRPGLAVVGVICYQGMLSPSSHQCQFIIAVLIVAGIADITLSHRLILKLAAKVFTWISCQQAAARLLTKKIFSEYLKMISQVLCTVAHQWLQMLLKCCRHHPQPRAHPIISCKEIMGLSRQCTAGDQEHVLFSLFCLSLQDDLRSVVYSCPSMASTIA